MDFVHRRMEIISILSAKRHITTGSLHGNLALQDARYFMILLHCLLITRFIQNRVRAVGFLLQKIRVKRERNSFSDYSQVRCGQAENLKHILFVMRNEKASLTDN
ncbi:hypothetical protein AMURIS_03234 [Acetatifactor muris]|uniref:Uncharacterized protein n=1 Tax=Acetatifactor muris TaxID=879566 RepID=A0A2K4ZJ42_9FIRM|nr:hypothetical protein [Acetatifactor muris]SOY30503.1 hypothetical protein AMURIS_03234 [Acetatifactor muris]